MGPRVTLVRSKSESETVALGRALGESLGPGSVVALYGELGAGKTRFVMGLASGLGHDARLVSSPTYVLANEYATPGARCPLVHVDAFRLDGESDLDSLGWDRLLDGSGVVVIEWAERIEGSLPPDTVAVRIAHADEESRVVTIRHPDRDGIDGARRSGSGDSRV